MKCLIILFTFFLSIQVSGQRGVTYVGIQLKPIVPNKFIGQYKDDYSYDKVPKFGGTITQNLGFATGVVIRHGISDKISIESGLNYVKRNYSYTYQAVDSAYSGKSNVGLINYNIPINGLIYIKLSDNWLMNASGGVNISFFPSVVRSTVNLNSTSNYFYQDIIPKQWIQFGTNANYGFEYRSKKNGTFYIGVSYYLPFTPISNSKIVWVNQSIRKIVIKENTGAYLTFDLKYFIHNSKY